VSVAGRRDGEGLVFHGDNGLTGRSLGPAEDLEWARGYRP